MDNYDETTREILLATESVLDNNALLPSERFAIIRTQLAAAIRTAFADGMELSAKLCDDASTAAAMMAVKYESGTVEEIQHITESNESESNAEWIRRVARHCGNVDKARDEALSEIARESTDDPRTTKVKRVVEAARLLVAAVKALDGGEGQ